MLKLYICLISLINIIIFSTSENLTVKRNNENKSDQNVIHTDFTMDYDNALDCSEIFTTISENSTIKNLPDNDKEEIGDIMTSRIQSRNETSRMNKEVKNPKILRKRNNYYSKKIALSMEKSRKIYPHEDNVKMKQEIKDDSCAICYIKFDLFYGKHKRGNLQILNQNENHNIHKNFLCKACVQKIMNAESSTCPFCREPLTHLKSKRYDIRNFTFSFPSFPDNVCEKFKHCISFWCKESKYIVLFPCFIVASPFLLVYAFINLFIMHENYNEDQRDNVLIRRIILVITAFFAFFGTVGTVDVTE